ncbi:MAG: hypothetical protein K0R67_544 [Paenibacillus sp.]|nr:hypothetical protein [Paenibacillus sp.]
MIIIKLERRRQAMYCSTMHSFHSTIFIPTGIMQFSVPADGKMFKHSIDSYMLILVTGGQGTLVINGVQSRMCNGRSFGLAPGSIIEASIEGGTDLQGYAFTFHAGSTGVNHGTAQLLSPEPPMDIFKHSGELEIVPFVRLVDYAQELYSQREGATDLQRIRNHACFQEMMLFVVEHCHGTGHSLDARQAVERVIVYMQRAFQEELSVERLAFEANVSKRQFSYWFKELTGRSTTEYLSDLRINRAKQLLLTEGRLLDIARTVGYRDEFYFSRRFKQLVGISPREYARNRKKQLRIFASECLGHLLSLGIKPVGAKSHLMQQYFMRDLVTGIVDIGNPVDNKKQVLELELDLIIASNEREYEQFSSIAPTVVQPYGARTAFDQLRMLGSIVGREQEAEQWINRFESKASKQRKRLAGVISRHATVSVIEIWADRIFVFGNQWGRGGYNIYNALRLSPPDIVRKEIIDKQRYKSIQAEDLPLYIGDHLFLLVYDERGGSERAASMKQSEIWKSLPAVLNDQVYELDYYLFFGGDPISLDNQLDIQVNLLLERSCR